MIRFIREAVAVFGLRTVVLELAVGSAACLSFAALAWAIAVWSQSDAMLAARAPHSTEER